MKHPNIHVTYCKRKNRALIQHDREICKKEKYKIKIADTFDLDVIGEP